MYLFLLAASVFCLVSSVCVCLVVCVLMCVNVGVCVYVCMSVCVCGCSLWHLLSDGPWVRGGPRSARPPGRSVHAYVFVCVCVGMCMRVYVYAFRFVCVCFCGPVFLHVCVCMSLFVFLGRFSDDFPTIFLQLFGVILLASWGSRPICAKIYEKVVKKVCFANDGAKCL